MGDLEENGGERRGGIDIEHDLNGREEDQFLCDTSPHPSQRSQAGRFAKRGRAASGSTSHSTDNASNANTRRR